MIGTLLAIIFSQAWQNIIFVGSVAGALTAIGVGIMKAVKAIWKAFKFAVSEAVDNSEHAKYTRHHLGPNGDTPPLWTRVTKVEESQSNIISELKEQSGIIQSQAAQIRDHGDDQWRSHAASDAVTEAAHRAAEETAAKIAEKLDVRFGASLK